MWTVGTYQDKQRIFFSAVNRAPNPAKARLLIETLNPEGGVLADFLGEGARTVTEEQYRCLYQRTISQDQRTKLGLDDEIVAMVTIPTLEVRRVRGTDALPGPEGVTIRLFSDHYDVTKITALEPFVINGSNLAIGYLLHLRLLADSNPA